MKTTNENKTLTIENTANKKVAIIGDLNKEMVFFKSDIELLKTLIKELEQ